MILMGSHQLRMFYNYDLNLWQKQFVLCGLAHLQYQNAVSLPAAYDNHSADNQSSNIPNWILCPIISTLAASSPDVLPPVLHRAHLKSLMGE